MTVNSALTKVIKNFKKSGILSPEPLNLLANKLTPKFS